MASFITKDSKPGPGVAKDAPEKRRFFLFFELLGAKIGKLIGLNFIYILFLIPLLFGLTFSIAVNPDIKSLSDILRMPPLTIKPDYISLIVLFVSAFLTGPATAGMTYVLRNLQRREHTWVFSDFWEHFRKNYIQGITVSLLDLVVYPLLYVGFWFYVYVMPQDMPQMGTFMPYVFAGFIGLVAIIYTWTHYYIYTMMVTFELKFSKLFKNSVIFAIGKLPLNLLITLIIIALVYVSLVIFAYSTIAFAAIFALILLSLIGFITVFSTYPTIDTLMLKRVSENKGRVLNTRG